MRGYARVAPQFWTGDTGREIRAAGADTQRVALYLMTCPSSNMIGLYYLPLPTLAHEVGHLDVIGASEALRSLEHIGFSFYDEMAEVIWVEQMARFQIAEELDADDKQIKGIMRQLAEFKNHRFSQAFHGYYKDRFHLPAVEWWTKARKPLRRAIVSPSGGPPKSGAGTGTGEGTGAGAVSPSASAAPTAPTPGVVEGTIIEAAKPDRHLLRAVIQAHAARFQKLVGKPLVIHWAKDAARVKPVLDAHGLDATLKLQEQFFGSAEGWWVHKHNYGIGAFVTAVDELAAGSLNGHGAPSSVRAERVRRVADGIREQEAAISRRQEDQT